MAKTSTTTIACALCVGSAHEPYLAAALAAISETVDVLVVNDNGDDASTNRATLAASAFAARGAMRVARTRFVDFADMRDRAFAMLRSLERRPDWVLFLDADEVHGEQVRYVARELLPRLGPGIGSVDAYTYHFFGTFRWISDVARRFMFYRYAPDLRWSNAIHEKIVGLGGRSIVLPYVYHHYGNVATPASLARKHHQYYALGNAVARPPDVDRADAEIFLSRASHVRPYRGDHPLAVRATLRDLEGERRAAFAEIDRGFERRRTPRDRAAGFARSAQESVRVDLRRFEHPFLYRAPTRAV